MKLYNSADGYGLVAIVLHWVIALQIIGLFVLGAYMVELDYYDKWYNLAPWWHKAVGMCVLALLIVRIFWVFKNHRPNPLPDYHRYEMFLATFTHYAFYILILLVCVSGYFITTAKGAGIDMFGWFNVPAITSLEEEYAELAGKTHALASYLLGLLFSLHLAASLKHHFSDNDATLIRIINPRYKGDNL